MSLPIRWENTVVEEGSCLRVRQTDRTTELERENVDAGTPATMPIVRAALILAAAVCIVTLLAASLYALQVGRTKPENLNVLFPSSADSMVKAAGVTASRTPGFVSVTGTVENRTAQNLSNVEAVVELLDRDSHTVMQDVALVETDLLPAGRASAFRVEVKDTAQAVACRVHFRKLMGAALN